MFSFCAISVRKRVELLHVERQIIEGVFYPEAEHILALAMQLEQLRDVVDALPQTAPSCDELEAITAGGS